MQGMIHHLAYADYLDRITAGWLGKSIGGAIGAPLENQKAWLDIGLGDLWSGAVPPNDDLDIQVVWLEALQERGLHLGSRELAEFWVDRCWYNFCEYGVFLHNLQRGINPPLSGSFNNEFFGESEGCPIRSEIWGFTCPGNPHLAAAYATADAQLDHTGASVEIERFLAACASQAMLGSDLETVLAAGLSVIPVDCSAARAVGVVRDICTACPEPAMAWRRIIRRYGDRDASKAITNHAIVLMTLFLGRLDFRHTMLLAARSGWDTDCTAATAGALLGAMHGTAALPADWVDRLGPNLVCGISVRHNDQPLREFARETALIGVEMAAMRNPNVHLTGAPAVTIRPPPPALPQISVRYHGEPALRAGASSHMELVVDSIHPGRMDITAAPHLLVTVDPPVLLDGTRTSFQVSIALSPASRWLPDRNLLEAVWQSPGQAPVRHRFGLAGARQWQVYGPYWDMWDVDRSPTCPYHNPQRRCPPGSAGLLGDTWSHHAKLDRAYLDEERLTRSDLEHEDPLHLQQGRELITEQDLGGFHGQACYYLVRTFRWDGTPRDCDLAVGRVGPYRLWLDGELVGAADGVIGWMPFGGNHHRIHLSGKPQRLVLKVVRLTDACACSITFLGGGCPDRRRGVSFMLEELSDAIVASQL
jgi:ADP-ribosylglycohydrolase